MEELDWPLAKAYRECIHFAHIPNIDRFKLNICRSFILPVVYGAFLAYAQLFLNKLNEVRVDFCSLILWC